LAQGKQDFGERSAELFGAFCFSAYDYRKQDFQKIKNIHCGQNWLGRCLIDQSHQREMPNSVALELSSVHKGARCCL
jgi:hypothetical protein